MRGLIIGQGIQCVFQRLSSRMISIATETNLILTHRFNQRDYFISMLIAYRVTQNAPKAADVFTEALVFIVGDIVHDRL